MAARSLHSRLHNYATSHHWLQLDVPHSPPKLPLPVGQTPPLSTWRILGPSQPTSPNGIQIWLAILPQYTGQTDTHTETDRWDGEIISTNTRLCSIDYSNTGNNIILCSNTNVKISKKTPKTYTQVVTLVNAHCLVQARLSCSHNWEQGGRSMG